MRWTRPVQTGPPNSTLASARPIGPARFLAQACTASCPWLFLWPGRTRTGQSADSAGSRDPSSPIARQAPRRPRRTSRRQRQPQRRTELQAPTRFAPEACSSGESLPGRIDSRGGALGDAGVVRVDLPLIVGEVELVVVATAAPSGRGQLWSQSLPVSISDRRGSRQRGQRALGRKDVVGGRASSDDGGGGGPVAGFPSSRFLRHSLHDLVVEVLVHVEIVDLGVGRRAAVERGTVAVGGGGGGHVVEVEDELASSHNVAEGGRGVLTRGERKRGRLLLAERMRWPQ